MSHTLRIEVMKSDDWRDAPVVISLCFPSLVVAREVLAELSGCLKGADDMQLSDDEPLVIQIVGKVG